MHDDDDTNETRAMSWEQEERDAIERSAKTRGQDPPTWLMTTLAIFLLVPLFILWVALVARLFRWAF